MLKRKIESLIKESIKKGMENSELGELTEVPDSIAVERPKSEEHGDRAISVAMSLAKQAKLAPRQVADVISKHLDRSYFKAVDIAGPGFINLKLDWSLAEDCIASIHEQDTEYGKCSPEERPDKSFERVLVEYVSANPTGDLHIGHGRQAVLGSALVSLLRWAGYEVESEFYINDAGVQIKKLGKSAKSAMLVKAGLRKEEDYAQGDEELYPLESMLEFLSLEEFQKEGDLEQLDTEVYSEIAKNTFLKLQKEILKSINIEIDTWYSEKQLHKANKEGEKARIEKALDELKAKDETFEKEGALWFKAEKHGDERDRVLVKSDGTYTYLTGDLAYHKDKLNRNFDKLIDIFGADHHGQETGLRKGLEALGEKPDCLEVLFIQMVALKEGEQAVKMSKRAGTIVTISELVKEVGADAFRYFLVESQANNHMNFDLELAKKQDKENPVYYIQYAHARCCSILRTIAAPQINQESKKEEAPVISEAELQECLENFKTNTGLFKAFERVEDEEALKSSRRLFLHLSSFTQEVKDAALARAPHRIANYLKDLASLFHAFYTHNRVIVEDKDLMKARLSLVAATQKVIRNGLELLAINAPEKM